MFRSFVRTYPRLAPARRIQSHQFHWMDLPADDLLLARKNSHPRDLRVRFDPVEHKYWIDGTRYPSSVSGLIHDAFPTFDGPRIVENGYHKWRSDKNGKYSQLISYLTNILGFDDEQAKKEILLNWSASGNKASTAGTETHQQIEYTLNEVVTDTSSPEFQQYVRWRASHPDWKPYRTEWSIFAEPELMCGQIDSLWLDEDDKLIMVDWKRVVEMKASGFNNQMGFPPFHRLPHSNYGHYVVQQNIYTWLLEHYYGLKVHEMYLVQVHPTINEAVEYPLPRIQTEIDLVMALRRDKVLKKELKVLLMDMNKNKRKLVDEDDELANKMRQTKLIEFHQSRIDDLMKE